jgi:hypothetical protein
MELVSITTGLPPAFTLLAVSDALESCAMFGYGIGTGPPGDGVWQTSGKAKQMPSVTVIGCAIRLLLP